MKPGWFIGFMMAFAILTLIFSVGEMSFFTTTDANIINVLLNPLTSSPGTWIAAFEKIITFKYTFFTGPWIIVRIILCCSVGAGFMIGLIIALIQGLSSAIGGLFRVIRGV